MNSPRRLLGWLLGRRLPTTAGLLGVDGWRERARIRRDGHGVLHVEAQDDADAWFGLGFCHGQDRSFQLEFYLRAIRGTLAELFGVEALGADRLSRPIGFHA